MSTAQVTARLSADASDFKSVMNDAEKHTGKVSKGIAAKFELKNLGQTMATAVGLNVQNMAQTVARAFTGMSEEMAAAMDKMVEASRRSADTMIANMRSYASETNKTKLELLEIERIKERLAKGKIAPDETVGVSWMARIKVALGAYFGRDGTGQLAEEITTQFKTSLDKDAAALSTLQKSVKDRTEKTVDAELKDFFGPLDAISKKEREAADAAKDRADATAVTTEEIVKQVEELEEVKRQTIEIARIGREDSELSDRELQRKVKNLRQGIDATNRSNVSDPNITRYLNQPAELELNRLKGEMDLRRQVRFTANRFGEDKAFQMFNLSESRFSEILRGQEAVNETNKLLRGLTDRFDRGIRVRSITTPGSDAAAA